MISVRTLITSAVATLMSGGVGFASASYLQHRASADRMKEIERQHELELAQIHQEAAKRLEEERRRQTGALHEQWYSDPLATQARVTPRTARPYARQELRHADRRSGGDA